MQQGLICSLVSSFSLAFQALNEHQKKLKPREKDRMSLAWLGNEKTKLQHPQEASNFWLVLDMWTVVLPLPPSPIFFFFFSLYFFFGKTFGAGPMWELFCNNTCFFSQPFFLYFVSFILGRFLVETKFLSQQFFVLFSLPCELVTADK